MSEIAYLDCNGHKICEGFVVRIRVGSNFRVDEGQLTLRIEKDELIIVVEATESCFSFLNKSGQLFTWMHADFLDRKHPFRTCDVLNCVRTYMDCINE